MVKLAVRHPISAGLRSLPYNTLKPSMEKSEFDEKRNLIVNYLPSSLSQDDVKLLFCRIGPVSNCKLIRNYETGQSLGYAFIEYPTEQLAADAICQLDGHQIEDKRLKVSYARQSSPDIKNSNVYVAGLPEHLNEDQLLQLFIPFGKVLTHKLLLNSDNTSRGVGFVRYALKSEAQQAIDVMSGKLLEGGKVPLTVKIAIPPVSKQQNSSGLMSNTMQSNSMNGGGGQGVVSPTITSLLKGGVRYNPLAPSNQSVLSPMITNTSSSYLPISAPNVPSNTTVFMQQQPSYNQVCTVYVFGLQPIHGELTLYELFAPFGGIVNVKIIRDLTKEEKPCKGFGFVNFRKYDEADTAVSIMNGRPFEGRNLQVSFKQNKNNSSSTTISPSVSAIGLQQPNQMESLMQQQYPSTFNTQLTGFKYPC